MGEVVNLRQVRKQRARAGKSAQAAENRARHGRTKAEKALEHAERDARDQKLAGHRLERPEEAEAAGGQTGERED
jgi:hypothetical protein